MEEKFYLYIQYGNKKKKVRVTDPNANLDVLINNLREIKDQSGNNLFEMPHVAHDGSAVDYVFGKMDEDGQVMILHSKRGKTEFCLRDYNVKNGEILELVADPKAG